MDNIIPNHFSAKLSDLDLLMIREVPPGGNWKNIPLYIPSKRLTQIRRDFELGKGSRSTYYGRLLPAKPAYTISTYFNRPGNGCFAHYDTRQDRLISQREAARLQTFPDSFTFQGSKQSINKQIGNAVPPVLGYQIAKSLGKPGMVVDLFTGAGGLSLGFHWAGWKSIIANDIDPIFLETYKKNIRGKVIAGDLRDKKIFNTIVENAILAKKKFPRARIIVIGGPPCQGFSTAGNQRSMSDERNHLFKNYKKILDAIKPDFFVFENVAGLMNMEGGTVFDLVSKTLGKASKRLIVWKVQAEHFGVPQRRTRVIIIGNNSNEALTELKTLTKGKEVSCLEALSDLPPIKAGEDGSMLNYVSSAKNNFQLLMRGKIDIETYLRLLPIQD